MWLEFFLSNDFLRLGFTRVSTVVLALLLIAGREPSSAPEPVRVARGAALPSSPVPSTPRERPEKTKSAPTLTTPVEVFRAVCLKCHDNDGRGEVGRELFPKVPDFTDLKWQASRSDATLVHSILEGKGKTMRPMKDKLGTVDARQMVAFIRAFRGGKQV